MWKKLSFLFVALLSIAALHGQTADEIIKNYFENTGGYEKWKSLTSQKATITTAMQGMEFKGTVYSKPPNKMKVEVDVMGTPMIQAYDGTDAWMLFPMQTGPDAQRLPKEQAEAMTEQTFEWPFVDYAKKGHTLALEGKEDVEGAEAYKLKLTKKNGKVQIFYFDAEHYVPIMMEALIESGPAKGQSVQTYMSDYQEVDGLMMPFFTEVKVGGQTAQKVTIQSVTLNEDLSDEMFAMPKKKEKEAAPASGNDKN